MDKIGPYYIESILGEGGMGVVYRAKHQVTGDTVALKTVTVPSSNLYFSVRREIHTLAGLCHPGIVTILDEGTDQGIPWYAMELIEGLTFRQVLLRHRRKMIHGSASSDLFQPNHTDKDWSESETSELSTHVRDVFKASTYPQSSPGGKPGQGDAEKQEPKDLRRRALSFEELSPLLELVIRLCSPLAYLHGEGVVHRDLKPENILVRPDGSPVLMDFGLVSTTSGEAGREVLQVEARSGGTVLYMSPEHIRGKRVDARSDLYSLGCMLYELVTGSPPFIGTSVAVVLNAHLRQKPTAPSRLNPHISAELENLIMNLLAKEPIHRIGYADDLARRLLACGLDGESSRRGPEAKPYLYLPGLVGRKSQVTKLLQTTQCLSDGEGTLVFLTGESGIGKTRLAMEFGQQAVKRDILVLGGLCQEGESRFLEAFRKPMQLIGDICREKGHDLCDKVFGPSGKVLSQVFPELQNMPGQEAYPEPTALSPTASRERLIRFIGMTLQNLAALQKVLLIIDDIQWADEITFEILHFLKRAGILDSAPLVILATVRAGEITEALQSLIDLDREAEISVERLEPDAVTQMVRNMLALSHSPDVFGEFLARHSEGNPLFVAEYVQAAVDDELLWRDDEGRWQVSLPGGDTISRQDFEKLPLPHSLKALISGKLARLSPMGIEMVHSAALLDRVFCLEVLAEVSPLEELEFHEIVQELLQHQVIAQDSGEWTGYQHDGLPGETEKNSNQLTWFRFFHDKIREIAIQRIEPAGGPSLHRRIAHAIEKVFTHDLSRFLLQCAIHWELAGEYEPARTRFLEAARGAVSRFEHDDAERAFRGYLKYSDHGDQESILARSQLAHDVLLIVGKKQDALDEIKKAKEEAAHLENPSLSASVKRNEALILWRTGEPARAREILEDIVRNHAADMAQGEFGVTLYNLGNICQEQGDTDSAGKLFHQALASIRAGGETHKECLCLGSIALLSHEQGKTEQALSLYKEALELAKTIGAVREEGILIGNLAILCRDLGHLGRARTYYQAAMDIAIDTGDRRTEGLQLSNLAALDQEEGKIDAAREAYEKCIVIGREFEDKRGESLALTSLAILNYEQGYVDEAHRQLMETRVIFEDLNDRQNLGIILGFLGILHRQCRGDLVQAKHFITRAEQIFRELNDLRLIGSCLCELGHLELAHNRSAHQQIEACQAIIKQYKMTADSDLVQSLKRVKRAESLMASRDTSSLFRGERIEDIPPPIVDWLKNSDPVFMDHFG